jgi:hypothetical protein
VRESSSHPDGRFTNNKVKLFEVQVRFVMMREISEKKRKEMVERIKDALESDERIAFAYLHGSFLAGPFRDIDLGIYIRAGEGQGVLDYELGLENRLEKITGIPTDVRALNSAPLPFRFNVVAKGLLLFSRDESLRSDFESLTFVEYHDFKHFRRRYMKEALGLEV